MLLLNLRHSGDSCTVTCVVIPVPIPFFTPREKESSPWNIVNICQHHVKYNLNLLKNITKIDSRKPKQDKTLYVWNIYLMRISLRSSGAIKPQFFLGNPSTHGHARVKYP